MTVEDLKRTISLLLEGRVRRVDGEFKTNFQGIFTYKAYTIEHKVGPPTIRIDIKEKI